VTVAHDWYFDVISPFAYLQWRRLRRDHPALRLNPKPVLLAGLLNHWGQLGPAELPEKRRQTYRLVLWQSRQLDIPLRFPPAHPFNPLPALRLALAADDIVVATDRIFGHIWEHGRAADPDTLAPLAKELGVDSINDEVKRQLAANGDQAIALGLFGVPTLKIGERLFWGNDATEMALQYLADPASVDNDEMRALDALPIGVQRPGAKA
jgi:2-hydroxychromene-2-carboxylate isomerase